MPDVGRVRKCEKVYWPNKAICPQVQSREWEGDERTKYEGRKGMELRIAVRHRRISAALRDCGIEEVVSGQWSVVSYQ